MSEWPDIPLECPTCTSWMRRYEAGWVECGACHRILANWNRELTAWVPTFKPKETT